MPPKPNNRVGAEAAKRRFDLEKKLDEAKVSLNEERKNREKLSRDKVALIGQLANLEQTLIEIRDRNVGELADLEEDRLRYVADQQKSVEQLRADKLALELALESNEVVEKENGRLKSVVQTLEDELRMMRADNERGEEDLKKEAFNTRMLLENLSRKTLRELTHQYSLKAKEAMHQESQHALDQNQTLQEDLDDRSLAVTNMMSEHHDNDNVLRKMRIERDLIVSTTALQEERLNALRDAKAEHEEIISETQSQIAELHLENKELEAKEREIQSTMDEVRLSRARKLDLEQKTMVLKAEATRLTQVLFKAFQQQNNLASETSAASSALLGDYNPVQNGFRVTSQMMTANHDFLGADMTEAAESQAMLAIWSSRHGSNDAIQWVAPRDS